MLPPIPTPDPTTVAAGNEQFVRSFSFVVQQLPLGEILIGILVAVLLFVIGQQVRRRRL